MGVGATPPQHPPSHPTLVPACSARLPSRRGAPATMRGGGTRAGLLNSLGPWPSPHKPLFPRCTFCVGGGDHLGGLDVAGKAWHGAGFEAEREQLVTGRVVPGAI